MAEITATMVKDLREKTGAGMMDCKKALDEAQGDMEAAIDWLRKKGLSAAAKKAGRVAAEGLVAVASSGNKAAMVEVNAETDFVARNESFQAFALQAAKIALETGADVEALEGKAYRARKAATVQETLTNLVATHRREHESIRRVDASFRRARASSLPMCTMRLRRISARSACWWRLNPRPMPPSCRNSASSWPCMSPPRVPKL